MRPAAITDPVERLRAGELHSARSTNLRLAATRLIVRLPARRALHARATPASRSSHTRSASSTASQRRYPHRFILADEVGLGKTIEAGLLIRELRARGVARRILILAPSGLVGQWQQELKTKFNLSFSLYNRRLDRVAAQQASGREPVDCRGPRARRPRTYAAWDEDRRREIAGAGWDMVSSTRPTTPGAPTRAPERASPTNLYRLVEQISDPDLARAQAMLLLTATPMQLHQFELYSLIELLDPALFPTFDDFDRHSSALRGLNATVECLKRFESASTEEREAALTDAVHWLGDDRAEIETRIYERRDELVRELQGHHRLSQVMVRNRKRRLPRPSWNFGRRSRCDGQTVASVAASSMVVG